MALQVRYIIRQQHIENQSADGVRMGFNILCEVYEDSTGIVKHAFPVPADFSFAQLPANIKTTLTTLKGQVIAALKVYFGTENVTLFVPPQEA